MTRKLPPVGTSFVILRSSSKSPTPSIPAPDPRTIPDPDTMPGWERSTFSTLAPSAGNAGTVEVPNPIRTPTSTEVALSTVTSIAVTTNLFVEPTATITSSVWTITPATKSAHLARSSRLKTVCLNYRRLLRLGSTQTKFLRTSDLRQKNFIACAPRALSASLDTCPE